MPTQLAHWFRELFGSTNFASGMIGTLVGGAIAHAGQRYSMREARRQRDQDRKLAQQAACSGLMFKLIRISSNIKSGTQVFREAFQQAAEQGLDATEPWQFCKEIANPSNIVHLDDKELGALLQLGEVTAFNEIASLDNLNNSFSKLLDVYNEKRRSLGTKLQVREFDRLSGRAAGEMTPDEYLVFQPYMFECNSIIVHILNFEREVPRLKKATEALQDVMKRRLGMNVNLSWDIPIA